MRIEICSVNHDCNIQIIKRIIECQLRENNVTMFALTLSCKESNKLQVEKPWNAHERRAANF